MSQALIKAFGANRTVRRDTNKETRVKGKRVDDVWETISVFASVQPMRADEIVEESNERNAAGVKVYSFDELKTTDTVNQFKADQIEFGGEWFEVVQVHKHLDNKMNLVHYKSICLKINIERTA